jgi:S1-C subfamily serine protease
MVQGSSAELAGLRPGYVITDVNGLRVRSTQELTRILAQMEAGRRVRIGYLYRSSEGWMPREAVAILASGN